MQAITFTPFIITIKTVESSDQSQPSFAKVTIDEDFIQALLTYKAICMAHKLESVSSWHAPDVWDKDHLVCESSNSIRVFGDLFHFEVLLKNEIDSIQTVEFSINQLLYMISQYEINLTPELVGVYFQKECLTME